MATVNLEARRHRVRRWLVAGAWRSKGDVDEVTQGRRGRRGRQGARPWRGLAARGGRLAPAGSRWWPPVREPNGVGGARRTPTMRRSPGEAAARLLAPGEAERRGPAKWRPGGRAREDEVGGGPAGARAGRLQAELELPARKTNREEERWGSGEGESERDGDRDRGELGLAVGWVGLVGQGACGVGRLGWPVAWPSPDAPEDGVFVFFCLYTRDGDYVIVNGGLTYDPFDIG